jgi:hypothetical protein
VTLSLLFREEEMQLALQDVVQMAPLQQLVQMGLLPQQALAPQLLHLPYGYVRRYLFRVLMQDLHRDHLQAYERSE